MDYRAHHDRLISRARERVLTGYKERHHIIPRCMGGDNSPENLVYLTPEEHYVVHQLLVKMHPHVGGLIHAAVRMARQCTGNKAYGWLRRRLMDKQRGKRLSPESIAKRSATVRLNTKMGKKRPPPSAAVIAKIAATLRGRKLPEARVAKMRGRKLSPEHVEKVRLAGLGRKHSPESRAKMSASMRGKKKSPEHCLKMGAINRGKTLPPETRAKMSASRTGLKRGPPTPEARARISAALTGRKLSEEQVAKMRAGWARRKSVKQPDAV